MDRLVDKSLTAGSFTPDAQSRSLPERVRTVVIGGGIVGASTAYHLAEHGDATAREVDVADGHALALRISFVGELGYELYIPADLAVNVYEAIRAAGDDLGLRHAGYLAPDSLRSEKGYRHLGHDIGPHDDPYEAGLGFAVSTKKTEDFTGRPALRSRAGSPTRRAVFVALRDPGPVFVHDETILDGNRPVGRMTSGAYGYTLGRACGIGTIAADTPENGEFVVDCGGVRVPADLSSQPFYDPANARMKG